VPKVLEVPILKCLKCEVPKVPKVIKIFFYPLRPVPQGVLKRVPLSLFFNFRHFKFQTLGTFFYFHFYSYLRATAGSIFEACQEGYMVANRVISAADTATMVASSGRTFTGRVVMG
jgi:hypothetical protein